ncbi:MAG: YggU family protein [Deltaproteobacteria bacterium]|nr:YggU family protein [Deltaproteobacteria bacterium]
MTDTKTIIRVRVLPRTSKNQIVGMDGGVFKVKLTAPPVEGKANKALVSFLGKKLGLPKRDIEIVSGEHSREKSIRVSGLPVEEVMRMLMV